MENGTGFVNSLFDFSFKEFITMKVIRILYVIGIVFAAIGTIGVISSAFGVGIFSGIIVLILSPAIFLLWVIGVRVCLEMVLVLFRISDNIDKLAQKAE